jgi:hypothetical protein
MPHHKQKQNLQESASDTRTSKIQQSNHHPLQTWKEEPGTEILDTTKKKEIMKHLDEMLDLLSDTKKLVCDVLTPCSMLSA